MIYIDFQGGAHGNYLEFVCNKFLANVTGAELPFDKSGAAHNKNYDSNATAFQCGHFFQEESLFVDSKIIIIQLEYDDLLPMSSISLLRAGNYNIDNDQLEINTYFKLDNKDYRWVLDNLINKFFRTQIQDSYNAVKDSSWPDIFCIDDFKKLPEWIQSECVDQHNLKLLQLDTDYPHCPRHILREFFKIGFQRPVQAGFITEQKRMMYDSSNDVLIFPYGCFYKTDEFINQMQLIAQWSGYELKNLQALRTLHQEFLNRQPYKDSKKFCDSLIERIYKHEIFDLPKLDLMQESYILSQLENHYGIELPADQTEWCTNSRQILNFFVK